MRTVIVSNPSSTPEMIAAASALARAGLLGRYHVPVAFDEPGHPWLRHLPEGVASQLLNELRRRPVPDNVPRHLVRTSATVSDLARVAVARSQHASALRKVRWSYHHAAMFDRAVSRSLTASDEVLLSVAGAHARRTVGRARQCGVEIWLDFPLPHHGAMEATLRDEVRRVPEYAGTMQIVSAADPPWMASTIHQQAMEADQILVLSTYARNTFVEAGIREEKIHLTTLGVDTDLFRPSPRARDGDFRVGFVGQITQRKGISYLVEAFRAAALRRSELLMVGAIIGNAPWANVPGVRRLPPCPRAQLPALYAQMDVVVLPSLAEGFGLTALEAMACGRPVIVSDHTFGRDLIEDGVNGWTVPIRDAHAIVERLRTVARNPELAHAMGQAARLTAQRYSWHRYGDRIATLMRSATGPSC